MLRRPRRIVQTGDLDQVPWVLGQAEAEAEAGSWVAGYLAYEAAPSLDHRLRVFPEALPVPLAWFGVYTEPDPEVVSPGRHRLGGWAPAVGRQEHGAAIEEVRSAIAAGDTYQVNLTFPMQAGFQGDPAALLARMLAAQPDCYGAWLDLGHAQVVSASPELFLSRQGRTVTMRPMKGTAPRGRWPEEDEALGAGLAASEKEQAGNLMIVDLLRNDLGRVAEVGSVRVPRLYQVERHPTVWQLTSTVTAELRPEVGLVGLLTATFPSGSVTGAPKVSTMAIIERLESRPRGVYCGAVGLLGPGPETAELAVAIRTGVIHRGRFDYGVGGGITYDSSAAAEYDECLWKARLLTRLPVVPDLLETMLYLPGQGIPLLPRHISRLGASAAYWGIRFDPESVGDALSAVAGSRRLRVRLILTREGMVTVDTGPAPETGAPVTLIIGSHARVDPADPVWYHKTADRSRYPESEDGTEVVMLNSYGEVTETNRSNLMARVEGRWVTPPLAAGCLPGVARQVALEEGKVTESPLGVDQLRRAEALAVTNALRGWRSAVLIG